jgi:hypothetical protein
MKGGALVADFPPLQLVIGGLLLGCLHSACQRRSGHVIYIYLKKNVFKVFSNFWHTVVFIY